MRNKVIIGLHILLGLAFVAFGLNKFLNFMAPPELPPAGGAFMGAMAETGYMFPLIALTEIIAGALILSRRFAPLGLVLLAPVSVNIVLFHLVLAPAGGLVGYVLAAINLYLLINYLPKYKPMLGAG